MSGGTPSPHKVEPEIVKPLGHFCDPRLGAVDDEVHTRHNRFERVQRLLGIAPADQDGIIGIAMQRGSERGRIPPAVPDLIQEVQVDVAIQRRNGRPLRDPFRCWRDLALIEDPRLQAVFDEPQHTPIPHTLPDKPEQLAVRNGRKVALEINFHHRPGPSRQVGTEGLGRHLGVPVGPIAIGAVVEVGLENRLQHQLHCGLHYAILHHRNPERARTALGLRDVHPAHRLETVRLGAQLLRQSAYHCRFLTLFHHLLNRHAIDPGRPMVGLDLLPSLPQDVFPPHLVVQTIELHRFILLGLAIEGSLQLPDCWCFVSSHTAIKTSSPALNTCD